jgi:tRNA (guanosine-2'-O-)-methyltransferase
MEDDHRQEVTDFLATFITEHKRNLMESVLAQRTKFVTIALEDIYQPHNASAVVRTADCFGIQEVHIIEGRNKFETSTQVLRGSGKWVDIIKYGEEDNNTKACFDSLKGKGYRLIGTTPHKDGISLPELRLDQPTALIFGTEETGLSDYAMEHVDEYLRIPMYGFTESFNLSVSAAISLYQIMTYLHASGFDFHLSEEEKEEIRLAWYRKVVRRAEALENEHFNNRTN